MGERNSPVNNTAILSAVRVRLVPRDEGFYPIFNQSAENIASAATCLQELVRTLPNKLELVDEIISYERSGFGRTKR
jgi:hypothetical protein